MRMDDLFPKGFEAKTLGVGYGFSEGPAADSLGNVYFSDGKNDSIHFYEIGKHVVPFVTDSRDANGMIFGRDGLLYVCEGSAHRIVCFDVKTKIKKILCHEIEGQHFNEPNDLATDEHGGFYFTDPNYAHAGQPTVMKEDTYYCSSAGKVTRVSTVCKKPNGILLSADLKKLYLADSAGQRIFLYDVTGPGQLEGERCIIENLPGRPDGLTLDEHENVYICMNRAGVILFDREASEIGRLDILASNTCFGGTDFNTLFLTARDQFVAIETKVTGLKPLSLRVR